MNIKENLKNGWQHVAIIVAFILLSCIYFKPVLLGKQLPQNDNIQAIGAAHEAAQYQEATGETAQWTNSMFGGMPTCQIKGNASSNIYQHINVISRLNLPYTTIAIVFLYMLGFYLLMLSLKLNKWLSAIGSIAFAFGSYNLIIIIAGHITKAYAIAIMPLVLAGIMLIFNNKKILGGILTTIALGMEVAYNHIQITYYLALAVVILVIAKFIYAIREKQLIDFWKNVATLIISCVFAILPATTNLWTTYEYGLYSTRGASELTPSDGSKSDTGLDKDYALSWSYGIKETPTLLIPNIVGGASEAIGTNLKSLSNLNPQVRQVVAQQSQYWGGRGFTSGPVYVGAIICFLFFLGCFYYKGREKWWLIAATIFSIMLAWGKNFGILTDFMFDYFPMYNKFRTVEMALVIATVTIPTLAMLGLKELYDNPERVHYESGKFFGAMALTAGFALIIYIAPTLFYSFLSVEEMQQLGQMKAQDAIYGVLEQGLIDARVELTRSDAIRSVVLIVLASSALWFFSVRKINERIAMLTIAILIGIDLWSVDKRYLNDDNFVEKRAKVDYPLTNADKAILADKEPHRVATLCRSIFNDATTSYYHQSIGGYHGAKMRRYQDIIDHYLAAEWQQVMSALQSQNYEQISQILSETKMMNALNTKYLIYNPEQQPLLNQYANGAAWFVDKIVNASSADEAINLLSSTDLKTTAVLETQSSISSSSNDSLSSIIRVSYTPDKLVYKSNSTQPRVAVFSEIFYPTGWTATIDGSESEVLRADYILRALQIPAGEHEIVFSFHPNSYYTGRTISIVASIVVAILIIIGIVVLVRKRKEEL